MIAKDPTADKLEGNVTMRKPPKPLDTLRNKMPLTAGTALRNAEDTGDPLLIDSILSKSEEGEVLKMLTIEGAMQEDLNGSIITTSSQMKSRRHGRLVTDNHSRGANNRDSNSDDLLSLLSNN